MISLSDMNGNSKALIGFDKVIFWEDEKEQLKIELKDS